MAEIRTRCPRCAALHRADESALGKRGRCKKCGAAFTIAAIEAQVAPTAAAPGPGPMADSRPHVVAVPSQRFDRAQDEHGLSALVHAPARDTKASGPWEVGQTVDGLHEVKEILGHGGMGIVYLAYDKATQKNVAVKVPLGKFVDDKGAKKRFVAEAEAWTELIHPHIVHAFDVKDDQTTDYRPAIFMDYCDGGRLAARLERGRLSLPEALDIAIQICWAMEFAHSKGHIHRDLKPGNVLLMRDGRVLVTDFGLVKPVDGDDAATGWGTPEYMPPEQWEGRDGKASDIYAFGVMLHELFCRRRPFDAPNDRERTRLREAHTRVAPPEPQRLNGAISAGLSRLLRECLEKEMAVRPKEFGGVAEWLVAEYRDHAGRSQRQVRPKPAPGQISRADQSAQADALIRLGKGCKLRGDLAEALRHCQKASKIYEQLGDKKGLQASLNNQALILSDRGDWGGAMALHKEAERICRELGNLDALQATLGNQASILYGRGDLEGAMALHKEEERICRHLGNLVGLGATLANQAVILTARGDLDGAMALHKEEEKICRQLGTKEGLVYSLANQALLLGQKRNRWREALPLAEEAHQIATAAGLTTRAQWTKKVLDEVRSHLRQ